ncbi:MAG: DedA family protein, partial [Tolumonas sp.]|nr:DedA family protein [Tolumonas sp.]
MDILISIFSDYGYVAVFVMLLLCGFGLPIPEDITLVAGGIIAGLGYADVHTMFAVCMAGVLIGDGTMF